MSEAVAIPMASRWKAACSWRPSCTSVLHKAREGG